jgi:hypothetical protein
VNTLICDLETVTTGPTQVPSTSNFVLNSGSAAQMQLFTLVGIALDGIMMLKPPSADKMVPFVVIISLFLYWRVLIAFFRHRRILSSLWPVTLRRTLTSACRMGTYFLRHFVLPFSVLLRLLGSACFCRRCYYTVCTAFADNECACVAVARL